MSCIWNPWRGCHRCSEGCKFCYIHKGDAKRGRNTNEIVKSENFYRMVEKKKRSGEYKVAPNGGLVYLCFQSDFLLEDADEWRGECWKIIKERKDCSFLFLTKRISRFMECVPQDWNDGYENVIVCCTVENQENADKKLAVFQKLPIKHKQITAQPLIGPIDLEKYLDGVEAVTVGGESDRYARPLYYDWVLDIRQQCIRRKVNFSFRQLGTHFVKDGKEYTVQVKNLMSQAKKAAIDVSF